MPRLQRTIDDFLNDDRELPALSPSDTAAAAAAKMKACRSDAVAVVADAKLVGVFTERDYLNRVVALRLSPSNTKLADVMTPDPEHLGPEDCVSYAINKMAVGGFRNVPVCEGNKLVGVLGVRDVMTHLFDLFAEASDRESQEINPWTDIGGG